MKIKNQFLIIVNLSLVFALLIVFSCKTEDTDPTVELSVNDTNLSENNGSLTITATLNAAAENQVIVPLTFSGTATLNSDYSVTATELTINSGNSSGSMTITALQDEELENVETILVSMGAVVNATVFSNNNLEISVLDDDTDTDGDGVLDANDSCPTEAGDVANNGCPWLGLLINEVLYDPAADAAGDANGDGTRDANDDEFIEFFNSGPALDISGYKIFDTNGLSNNTPRHIFPEGTVVPVNGVIVVFGGGTPTENFGGAIIQTASSGQLNINNSDDFVTVQDNNGNVILTFDVEALSNNPDESYTRNPDLTGEFEQHSTITEADGALFSPGTKLDGSLFQ